MDMDTFIEQAEKRIAELKQQNGNHRGPHEPGIVNTAAAVSAGTTMLGAL